MAEYKVEGTPVISSQINMAGVDGTGKDMASNKQLLYHSRTNKSNDKAVAAIGIKKMK